MESYLGEIKLFGGNFAPRGWAFCNGQSLNISEYNALYSLIGTTYGGDGATTFNLPNLQGRLPVHTGKIRLTGTLYPLGSMGGTESVTLVPDQLAAHTHVASAQGEVATVGPTNGYWATGPNSYTTSTPNAGMSPTAISMVGGNQAHENRMPFLALSFIICLEGVFPPPNA